ncbi:MAG TPA: 4Fe-4S dicluster domain-containing protein, partial [Candidatus Synoicihabitans sp.]|nr:4Fe-4S dicluster domain-containing protein [Candidatus Synoicihabitans sp.]
MVTPSKHPTLALIDELLAEQQRLQTPVAAYSRAHDNGPALAPVYRDLIPLTAPAAGEQYAFEVDLDSCSGCKACVAGCHSLNGLDETETWRDVGALIGGDAKHPFQQTITSACHHCADPACLNGCPVLAYDKDPITGIVRHLDDQCIGCSYCILKCPYDVPKYSERLGIVRKCDMCHNRLAAGEAPACVQACPTHAIRIVKVAISFNP